jgi:uncharacterized RDD family membrane protein YckC
MFYGATKHAVDQRRAELSPSLPNVGENLSHEDTDVMPPWKKELNERLAATRTRRLRHKAEQIALPGLEREERKLDSRTAMLAAKVAQRYANAPSYSEVLAAEAEARAKAAAVTTVSASEETHFVPQTSSENWSVTLEVEQEVALEVIEEEPASAVVEPLAVNLIEYPRELVAARKLRPRLAEGPLRAASEEEEDQLKIFEVAPESISQTVSIGPAPADWSPIRLDNDLMDSLRNDGESQASQIPLKTATLEDRVMAGVFDLALIVAAFAVFVLVFVACTAHPPTGKPALLSAGFVLAGFCLLYQFLFFKFAEGTPGMRYAKIALCTFDDENPTRKATCRRVLFLLLSAAPLGLGFFWAWFDPDRLTWHDRLSRIYQRSYS